MMLRRMQRCRMHAAGPHQRLFNPRTSRRVTVVRCSTEAQIDKSRRVAARTCVDRFVKDNTIVALGPGELTTLVIEEIGVRLAQGKLQGVTAVPVSDVAAHEAAFHGVPLLRTAQAGEASILLADADQVDLPNKAALVGCSFEPQQPDVPRLLEALSGGGPRLILLTESSRVVSRLGGSLPVWLDADNWEEVAEELDDIFLGDAEIWRRSAVNEPSNPRGGDFPYISSQGLTIVDVRFYEGLKLYGEDESYDKIGKAIQEVSGVVGHGLIVGRAAGAVVARPGEEPQVAEF